MFQLSAIIGKMKTVFVFAFFLLVCAVPRHSFSQTSFNLIANDLESFHIIKIRVESYLDQDGKSPNDTAVVIKVNYAKAIGKTVPNLKISIFSQVVGFAFPFYQQIQDADPSTYSQQLKDMDEWAVEYFKLVKFMLERGADPNTYGYIGSSTIELQTRIDNKSDLFGTLPPSDIELSGSEYRLYYSQQDIVPAWIHPILRGNHRYSLSHFSSTHKKKEYQRLKELFLREKLLLQKLAVLFAQHGATLDLPAYQTRTAFIVHGGNPSHTLTKVELLKVDKADNWVEWFGKNYIRWGIENSRIEAGNFAFITEWKVSTLAFVEYLKGINGNIRKISPLYLLKSVNKTWRSASSLRNQRWNEHKNYKELYDGMRRRCEIWVREMRKAVMARDKHKNPEKRKLKVKWNGQPEGSTYYKWERP